ncbi:lariat debranching enzyme [Sorochytrium milnesiophthora]
MVKVIQHPATPGTGPSLLNKFLQIAVEGCAHGALNDIYAAVRQTEVKEGITVDLVIICGDFQAIRNQADLDNLAVPPKYRELNDFHEYYSGARTAPYLTIFIGGNHESSAYLWELYHGGWAAPNIYFLGFGGVVQYKGIRIGGISGIFKSHDYHLGHFETAPYDQKTMRSIYHVRKFETMQMSLISEPVDVFVSHDWPRNIGLYGNVEDLYRRKTEMYEEIMRGEAGSHVNEHLLHHIKPRFWFSAHMHKEFAAIVPHGRDQPEESYDLERFSHLSPTPREMLRQQGGLRRGQNPRPPLLASAAQIQETLANGGAVTKFLALDKCLPGRRFLRVVDVEASGEGHGLQYDREWLSIVRATSALMPRTRARWTCPDLAEMKQRAEEERKWVDDNLTGAQLCIPENFMQTAPDQPSFLAAVADDAAVHWQAAYHNPQMSTFCTLLQIADITAPSEAAEDEMTIHT